MAWNNMDFKNRREKITRTQEIFHYVIKIKIHIVTEILLQLTSSFDIDEKTLISNFLWRRCKIFADSSESKLVSVWDSESSLEFFDATCWRLELMNKFPKRELTKVSIIFIKWIKLNDVDNRLKRCNWNISIPSVLFLFLWVSLFPSPSNFSHLVVPMIFLSSTIDLIRVFAQSLVMSMVFLEKR